MNTVPTTHEPTPRTTVLPVRPAVDVFETDSGYVLLADMPGVTTERLEVHVEDGQLTLHGTPAETPTVAHQEFRLRPYHCTFTLADALDSQHISARFLDGVLKLEIPKAAKAQVRKVPVLAG